jgi:ECF sigma factor
LKTLGTHFSLGFACRTELSMNEVTRILDAIGQGEAGAAAQLLPLVYDELRRLAAQLNEGQSSTDERITRCR